MKKTTFCSTGNFYKGNLHCHSTCSDGNMSPQQLVDAYRQKGYHFLCFTEHNLYSNYHEFDSESFITIQGVEANPMIPNGEHRAYHFIAIPGSDTHVAKSTQPMFYHGTRLATPVYEDLDDIQQFIDNLHERGYMVMICHPSWSKIEYDDILYLDNLFAAEIFNYCSYQLENVGESNVCYDALLRNDKKIWCTAVDDNHNVFPIDSSYCDSFGGFIVVKAAYLSERNICNAIAGGSFYSSMGPEIYDFYVENGWVYFSCSPVERIYINGDLRQINVSIAENLDHLVTNYAVPLVGTEKYVRAECYDIYGRKAYTNPIWLDR